MAVDGAGLSFLMLWRIEQRLNCSMVLWILTPLDACLNRETHFSGQLSSDVSKRVKTITDSNCATLKKEAVTLLGISPCANISGCSVYLYLCFELGRSLVIL